MEIFLCISCKLAVGPRQEAFQCDGCSDWQHRKCGTGIDRDRYREISRQLKRGEDFAWKCIPCTEAGPSNDSTHEEASENRGEVDDFDEFHRPYAIPVPILESSLLDTSAVNDSVMATPNDVTYTIVETASQRGKRKLVDSDGFSYTVKRQKNENAYWICSVRNKTTVCSATVQQKGTTFVPGGKPHSHTGKPGALTSILIHKEVKEHAIGNVFQSAPNIVEDVYTTISNPSQPETSRPKFTNLVRNANRVRQKTRPKDPVDLQFMLDTDFLPDGFFRKDVIVDDERHLIFATDKQLNLLAKAKSWYLDGTFKVIKKPFIQLFSVHAFVKGDDALKQLPLAFCVMSRKRKRDYKKVLKSLVRMLPSEPLVERFVLDFEAAAWQAIRSIFNNPKIQGCVFHWTQAIWRKVQELGLQVTYNEKGSVFSFVRQLMALPFLPAEHIVPSFQQIKEKNTNSTLALLLNYIDDTWMTSTMWSVDAWSVFMMSVRTNNDVEGWHTRLNSRTGGKVPFYMLLLQLHKEATLLPIQLRLVSEGKLCRYQRKKVQRVQCSLFNAWEEYNQGRLSTKKLLKRCSRLNGPIPI